jgi:hypothetical protein
MHGRDEKSIQYLGWKILKGRGQFGDAGYMEG